MAQQIIEKLLTNASTTGAAVKVGQGGQYVFDVVGTFGGATVKLQRRGPDNTTWLDVGPEASFTANGLILVTLSAGFYRASISGGSPSGIHAALSQAF